MTAYDALQHRFAAAGQSHVFAFWDSLDPAQQDAFAADLESVDLEQIAALHRKAAAGERTTPGSLAPLPQFTRGEDAAADARAREVGEGLLRDGKVAAFTVAGGQGTRLGHDGPKGTFPATPIKGKPLFQVFAEKLLALGDRFGRPVPWYLMTSPLNHEQTTSFFESNDFFGLDRDQVMFFSQGTMPAVDDEGRLILSAKDALFRSPDGHGGSLRALHASGAIDDMRTRGVEEIYYFQVDNPVMEMCDPVFMGYHRMEGSEFSSKVVPKREPGEKVGVLAEIDGKPGVIEYSDLADSLRDARDDDGKLTFRAGNIAVHGISRAFVEKLNEGTFGLPFHIARKEIPGVQADGTVEKRPGVKFETFVFDALPLASKVMVLEVPRASEFSPIKNREGSDSPETSRRDQSAQFASWLIAAGVAVPTDDEGFPTVNIEISPRFADSAEALLARKSELPASIDGDTYLG